MLTYSVKPRGGVVHALEVSEALARRGHGVELIGARPPGGGAVPPAGVPLRVVRHVPPDAPFDERVQAMLAAYADGPAPDPGRRRLRRRPRAGLPVGQRGPRPARRGRRRPRAAHRPPRRRLHARRRGRVPGPLDRRAGPGAVRLRALGGAAGARSSASTRAWCGNGVDARRSRPARDAVERARDRELAGLGDRLAVLTVGGDRAAQGLADLARRLRPPARGRSPTRDPVLLIAGGAPLFDYRDELGRFDERARCAGRRREHVRVLGPRDARGGIERLVPGGGRVRVPVGQGGLRPGGAGGAGRRPARRGVRHRRVPRLPRRRRERAAGARRRRGALGARAGAGRARPGAARALRRGAAPSSRQYTRGRLGRRARARVPAGVGSAARWSELEAVATFHGGYAGDGPRARARDRRSTSRSTVGGEDAGMMPTEAADRRARELLRPRARPRRAQARTRRAAGPARARAGRARGPRAALRARG